MAPFLALALSLFIVETDMPHRKPPRKSATAATPKQRKTSSKAAAALLKTLHPHAAGIDVGSAELWVCVPHSDEPPVPPHHPAELPTHVRRFGTFSVDLRAVAAFLRQARVDWVALESTGIYWIALYDLLQSEGFEVTLVDPRQTQRVPGRPKTDVKDCMWIQRLHSLGLLTAALGPDEPIRVLRSYQCQRQSLIQDGSRHIQRMQKALEQRNVKLPEDISAITGVTGMAIVGAILGGQRDGRQLAKLRDRRCKEDEQTIALALEGTWQAEQLFALKQSLAIYTFYQQQLVECAHRIEQQLQSLALPEKPPPLPPRQQARKRRGNELHFDARNRLYAIAGVDLTAIEGIEANTALVLLSEIGTDMTRWSSVKAFGSWLGLAPNPKKSGGRLLSAATRPGFNRAAQALRLAARNLQRSQSALGAFFRRIAARRGVPKAITATAYKLARIVYAMLKHGTSYAQKGMDAYEAEYRERQVRLLQKKAKALGFVLMELSDSEPQSAEEPA